MSASVELKIRLAIPSERLALEALQWRASLPNPLYRDSLLAHPDAISLPVSQIEAGGVFVAESHESEVLGFAAILAREDGDSELDGLFVEPRAWRRGVGRALVEHCCEKARLSGARSLHLIGSPEAEAFYRSCGFVCHGTVPTRFGSAFLMTRALR